MPSHSCLQHQHSYTCARVCVRGQCHWGRQDTAQGVREETASGYSRGETAQQKMVNDVLSFFIPSYTYVYLIFLLHISYS